jgi:cytochrome c oxidase subunit II
MTRPFGTPLLSLILCGCGGAQSILSPLGDEAGEIDALFWMVAGLSAAILGGVVSLAGAAVLAPAETRRRLAKPWLIIWGGIVVPVVSLTGFLTYGLIHLQAGASRGAQGPDPMITIVGKRWWWEVRYTDSAGNEVRSANELYLPVGRAVAIRLVSDDVIHSFWVPRLAGKLDMIPGRETVMTIRTTEQGISRGQCAEFCGGAHAMMSLYVMTLPEIEFQTRLQHEASPSRPPATDQEKRGLAIFSDYGCGACHTIRGTSAVGTIGPDLTHVGSRMSLGAATLQNDAASFARWIADNRHIKPENLMPAFRMFNAEELADLSAYLDSLQ